ncbi:amino acid/amide ABC transporter substrate-binding protein, HAAT family [Burkholderia sp. CF099]|nr:amino acid/amide ABC transporter substrate-binding protein, HAAT family [Burkholderia sp. CF099]
MNRCVQLAQSLAVFLGALLVGLAASMSAAAQSAKPIRIGVPAAIQLQVGRDAVDAVQMAVDEINAEGGLLGRKLEMVVADETENPEQGISAIRKLTADEKVDVLIGGYASGVALAEMPHVSQSKTIYLGIGAASPSITAKVKSDYANFKYFFRVNPLNSVHLAQGLVDFVAGGLKGELAYSRVAIVGENAKWAQDIVPILKKGIADAGIDVRMAEFFDAQTTDFSPLFSKARESGAQFMVVLLSHTSSDTFVKQWYDARVPLMIGGIDTKSQDADFYQRVGGKAIGEITTASAVRAPVTPKTIPFWDAFLRRYNRAPVYTAPGAYDATHIYAEAVERANSTSAEALIPQLEKTDYVGVVGRVAFDDAHDVRAGPGYVNVRFSQWQDNGARVIVWPKDLRTGRLIMPPWMRQ